jgi:predicted 3-demethylubiquinone-9 3-methyltransferase (glyoxalase superfamily)
MTTVQKITPCLWFSNNAEEAVNFYLSIFDNSRIIRVSHYSKNMPMPEGAVLTIDFELAGQRFQALNGGPMFTFTEAISLSVDCETQAEIDRYWDRLTSGGGKPVQCGWLKDKYGLSWQIVPSALAKMMQDGSPERTARAMAALMGMVKLDIAALKKAYDGA